MKIVSALIVAIVFFLFPFQALARDFVIANIKVYNGPGSESEPLAIRISDGVISEFGRGFSAEGALLYAGDGGYITPGFIDSASTLGLEEVELSTYAEDQKYDGTRMSVAFDPGLAFNRGSSMIPLYLEEGITRILVKPDIGADVFSGQGRVIRLPDAAGLLDESPRAVFVYFGESGRYLEGQSRAAVLQRLLAALEEAILYDSKRRAYENGRLRSLSFPMEDLEVLASVVRGEKKLALYIDRAAEIETVLQALDPYELDIVIFGGREAWKVTDALTSRNIPVIINAMDNRPSNFDRMGVRLDQARLLHDAGVQFAFMTEDLFTDTRLLSQAAGVAVAYDLPWQAALDAITISPARIWGLDDRVGSIEIGKEATFLIWSGDPLELTSHVRYLVVAGKIIEPVNRQKMLRDRYRELEEITPFSYR